MKIQKTITVTATEKEIRTICDFLSIFEDMDDDTWHALNDNAENSLGEALSTIQEIYDIIVEDNN